MAAKGVTPGVGRRKLIKREIGRQNRIVLPPEVMKFLDVDQGDLVEFQIRDDEVVLYKLDLVRRN